jgi:elongation factor G
MAISAANRNDEVKLSGALQRLAEEDTSVTIAHNAAMGELIISAQGDTQIMVLGERLTNRFNLTVNTRHPACPIRNPSRNPSISMPATKSKAAATVSSVT